MSASLPPFGLLATARSGTAQEGAPLANALRRAFRHRARNATSSATETLREGVADATRHLGARHELANVLSMALTVYERQRFGLVRGASDDAPRALRAPLKNATPPLSGPLERPMVCAPLQVRNLQSHRDVGLAAQAIDSARRRQQIVRRIIRTNQYPAERLVTALRRWVERVQQVQAATTDYRGACPRASWRRASAAISSCPP